MKTTLIAAMTEDRVIGQDGEIPWYMPEDQEHFYNETFGHPVIMGRKTFENIVEKLGHPLQGRLNIVLSSEQAYAMENVVAVRSKQAAIEAAEDLTPSGEEEVFVAGGESVYEQFIDEADRMVLTWIKDDYDGDVYYPDFSMNEWKAMSQTVSKQFTVMDYERR